MRMHSYGKCSPNLVVGALTVFSLILLYNYWSISTLNKDLVTRLRSLEQELISVSKANDEYEKDVLGLRGERTKLERNLQAEKRQEKECYGLIQEKDVEVKRLRHELEAARKSTEDAKQDTETLTANKNKDIATLKDKLVGLEAQVAEKSGTIDKLHKELDLARVVSQVSTSKSTAAGANGKPVPVAQPDAELAPGAEPKLINDPAVPYPAGWMIPGFERDHKPKVAINDTVVGMKGMKYHGSPIIIFDKPDTPVKKARFSVVDPPKTLKEAHGLARDADPPSPLGKPDNFNHGGEDVGAEPGHDGFGVLQAPDKKPDAAQVQQQNVGGEDFDQMQLPLEGGNLDAAEDDMNQPFKDNDPQHADDQSPDGFIQPKENGVGVGAPPPNLKHDSAQANNIGHDVREAAHL